jgi:LacI family transcriptional regulator
MVTTYDIAKRTGLNQSTVSRVLSGFPHVNPKTAKKVYAACRKLNYVPNVMARGLKTRRTRTIAIHMPYGAQTVLADPFVPVFLSGVSREAGRLGFSVLISHAVIITSPSRNDPAIETLIKENIPFVTGHYENRVSGHSIYVDIDNRHSGYQAGKFLILHGHKKIALVTEGAESIVGQDFHAGLWDALKEASLKPEARFLKRVPITFEAGFEAGRELLAEKSPPTAIIANTALTVFGVLEAARKFGKDICVLGIASPLLKSLHPELPMIQAPIEELGRQMAAGLIELIQTGKGFSTSEPRMLYTQIIDEQGNIFMEEP